MNVPYSIAAQCKHSTVQIYNKNGQLGLLLLVTPYKHGVMGTDFIQDIWDT